jgi:transcriptional regulator with XRE-family HTH domain
MNILSIEKEQFITKEINKSAIILSMESNFSQWLEEKIDEKGWSWNKLAENAGLSSGTMYNIRDGTRGVGENSLRAIAGALQLPVEIVYRAAGFLPKTTDERSQMEELKYLAERLSDEDLQEVIDYARHRLEKQESRQVHKKQTSRRKKPARSALSRK